MSLPRNDDGPPLSFGKYGDFQDVTSMPLTRSSVYFCVPGYGMQTFAGIGRVITALLSRNGETIHVNARAGSRGG
jgi:hypothetical protein